LRLKEGSSSVAGLRDGVGKTQWPSARDYAGEYGHESGYEKGVKETCRHAQVVFDKFHVIAHANQAVDEVRRAEVRLGGAGVWEALRQSQWLWRKNPENLTEKEAARLAQIDQKSLRTAKAYQDAAGVTGHLSESSVLEARRRFRVWCRWVRWVARLQPKNLLAAMVKVAAMIERHLAASWRIGNGV